MSNRVIARLLATSCPFALALAASSAHAAIVQNGSFELLTAPFVNSGFNYMQLAASSTELAGWTVTSSGGHIVLGQTETDDQRFAADGTYFVDLSGFGAESSDGAVSQKISTVGGATYAFSIDLAGFNDAGAVFASVGGQVLTLSAGASFTKGLTPWTTWTGAFTGDALDHSPTLTIGDQKAGSQLDFIDDVSIIQTSPGVGGVPEPQAWSLMILGFGGLGAVLRRRRTLGLVSA
jgi:hypothetical protein